MKLNIREQDKVSKEKIGIFDKDSLVNDIRKLGVKMGDLIHIKVSLSSIGYVEGGAETLIEALLDVVGETGTIIADAFVLAYPLPLSKEDAKKISGTMTPSYAGAVANVMIKHPKMFRSLHPIQKFVAIGAEAEKLMKQHTANSYAYDVLRVLAEKDAKNLKIGKDQKVAGVGTTHVAIGLLGFRQKRALFGVNYRDEKGKVVLFKVNWAGGCARGFSNFLPLYKSGGAVLVEGKIGNAEAKITSMKKTLEIEMEVLTKKPAFFLCNDLSCISCRLTWKFSNGNVVSVIFHKLLREFKEHPIDRVFTVIFKKIELQLRQIFKSSLNSRNV